MRTRDDEEFQTLQELGMRFEGSDDATGDATDNQPDSGGLGSGVVGEQEYGLAADDGRDEPEVTDPAEVGLSEWAASAADPEGEEEEDEGTDDGPSRPEEDETGPRDSRDDGLVGRPGRDEEEEDEDGGDDGGSVTDYVPAPSSIVTFFSGVLAGVALSAAFEAYRAGSFGRGRSSDWW